METVEDIVIVGADPAGLATAIGLQKLVLSSPRGTSAKISLQGAKGKRCSGKLEFRSVRRDCLLGILAKELPKDTIRYSSKVVSIEEDGNLKLLHLADGSIIKAKVVVGCDGINSAVDKYIGLKEPKFSGLLSTQGFAEYPTNHGFKPEFLVITGKGFHAGMLPCSERSIYWYFTWRPSNKDKIDQSMTKMRDFIIQKLTTSKAPKEIIEVIKRSEMDNVVSSSLKSRSLFSFTPEKITKRRNACLIGEPLKPLPVLGLHTELEESVVLVRYLSDAVHKGKIEKALEKFAHNRWDRIAELSMGASMVQFVVKSTCWFLRFRRFRMEEFWVIILATELRRSTDYDCGKL